jgi:hypothetical protein
MALIEFFLDHWYLLVVLFIFLSSFLGKNIQDPTKGRNRMPDFGGSPQTRPTKPSQSRQGSGRELDRKPVRTSMSTMTSAPKAATVAESETLRRESPFSAPIRGVAVEPRDDLGSPLSSDYDVPPDNVRPTVNRDLVQGMIWAEILGPPRAKKPYRKS